jgi:hypothetical protein
MTGTGPWPLFVGPSLDGLAGPPTSERIRIQLLKQPQQHSLLATGRQLQHFVVQSDEPTLLVRVFPFGLCLGKSQKPLDPPRVGVSHAEAPPRRRATKVDFNIDI